MTTSSTFTSGGCSVQVALDVDIDHPIPFIDLEGRQRRNRHDSSVIHHDIDAAETVDSSLDECFHFSALRDVHGEADSLTACGRNLFRDCVDPVLTPCSEYDSRPSRARSFAVLSPMPMLAPVITTTLSAIFGVLIFYSSLFADTSKITSSSTGVPSGRLATPYTERHGFFSFPKICCNKSEAASATLG